MTKTAHTPGPWVFDVIMGDDPNGDEWPEEVEVTSSSGIFIHNHDLGYDDDVDDQIFANARLIAAAPDLLEAAQLVMDCLNERISEAMDRGHPVPVFTGIAALHEAIAKAKGGAE